MVCSQYIVGYFSTLSDTIAHYQYLGILFITGTAFLLRWSIQRGDNVLKALSLITEFVVLIYLIFGLFVYREMILEYGKLFSPLGKSKFNLSTMYDTYIVTQSWIGLVALAFFISSLVSFIKRRVAK